jgi:hypothetical protein
MDADLGLHSPQLIAGLFTGLVRKRAKSLQS